MSRFSRTSAQRSGKAHATASSTRNANEDLVFDGVAIDQEGVDLLRMAADQFGPEVRIETSLTIVAGTQRYAFM